ncbi:hypothetical protein JOM56_013452 [Amanita muscaria]
MPPKLQLMPGLRMTTRALNKDKHPGSILLGNSRRSSEEMNQLHEEAAAQREAKEERLTVAIKNVAQIEDKLRGKDNELELEHRRHREELRKAVVDEEESSNVSNDWDPDYEKPASGSEARTLHSPPNSRWNVSTLPGFHKDSR